MRALSLLMMTLCLAPGCKRLSAQPQIADSDGPALYKHYCALCHGAKAKGYAADNAPSLVSATFAATAGDNFLRTSIERGRPGTAMAGYGKMVGGPLNTTQIASIIAFLREGAPPPLTLPLTVARGDVARGKIVYESKCARCHGTQMQRADAVHLFNGNLLTAASDAFLRYAVVKGRPDTRMEPFEGKLDPQSIDDVVAYLRSFTPPPAPLAAAPPPPMPSNPAAGMEAAMPLKGPLVINAKGRAADLKLREDRFASLDDVKAALDGQRRIVIIDARAPSDWLRLHIPGSISVPYYDMKALDRLPNDDTWIIAYCACPHHASGVVVDELRKRNYKHSAVLDEGIFAWQQKGYPVVAAPGALPVPAPPKLVIPGAPTAMPPPGAAPTTLTPPSTTGKPATAPPPPLTPTAAAPHPTTTTGH